MSTLIDRELPDGRKIADVLFAAFDAGNEMLNFVDVGARNGNYLLPECYAGRCRITGFEPNRVEYEKLITGRTDASAAGLVEPTFKDRKYFPHALWSSIGEQTLFLTAGVGAATLMGPVDERVAKNMWRENDRAQNFFDRVQRLVKTEPIDCVTLDHIWSNSGETIDVLKLDVEGGEIEVLKGARALLAEKRILLIYSEAFFVSVYEPSVTLGHQHVFLEECGYRLIALNLNHPLYCFGRTSIRSENDRWLNYGGDAIFILDPDRNLLDKKSMYRVGLACLAFGFNSAGLNLIRNTGFVQSTDIDAIEAEANRISWMRWLRTMWIRFPEKVDRVFRSLRIRS